MKKTVSLLIAFLMVLCIVPVEAKAAQVISTVSVGGIIPPAVGGKAVEMTTAGILYVSDTAPYSMELQSCNWKDESGKTIDNIDYEFEAGRTYSTSINFYAKEGWTFNSSDNIKVEIKGVNSSKFTYEVTYNSGGIITVNFIFSVAGSRTYPDIKKVEFWNINTPKEGNKPINSVTHLYDNATVYTSYWSYNRAALNSNNTFTAGRIYEFNIILDANSGYKFSDDVDVWYHNGPIGCKTSLGLNGTRLIISIPYYVGELKEISYIEITSLIIPKAGTYAYPVDSNFICVPESEEYRIGSFSTSWITSSGNVITGNDTFVEGQKYTAKLYFYANEGYRFAEVENISVRLRGVDYNKYSVEVRRTQTDFCTVLITFTAEKNPSETYITHVDVIGVYEPIAGDFVTQYGKTTGKSECRILNSDGSSCVYWFADDTQETVSFKENTSYTVKIWLEGYERYFATDGSLTATINGKPAKIERKGAKQTMISYTFNPTGEKADHNVTFEKNDGSGEKSFVKANGDYRLPNCMFVSPKDKNFVGWLVDGEVKQPLDIITVNDDIIIKAVWGDIEEVPISISEMAVTVSGLEAGSSVGETIVSAVEDSSYSKCYTVSINGWYDSDQILCDENCRMGTGDKFAAGRSYVVELKFMPTGKNIINNDVSVLINGEKGGLGGYVLGGGRVFRAVLKVQEDNTGITLSNMVATVSGFKSGSITGATKVTVDDNFVNKNRYTVSIISWYSSDDVMCGDDCMMSKADRFTEGKNYVVEIRFTPTGNNVISQNATVLINGKEGHKVSSDSQENIYRAVIKVAESKPLVLPGDGNVDGKVSMADLLLLRKYLAGMSVTIDLDAVDVNNDGKVSMADLLLIRKYLAGMDVTLK